MTPPVIVLPDEILAGPIVRRSEPTRAFLWFATRSEVELAGTLREKVQSPREPSKERIVGQSQRTRRARLGQALYVHLIEVEPIDTPFAGGIEYAYDVQIKGSDASLLEKSGLGLRDSPLPSLLLQPQGDQLRILDGSCRKLHGKDKDALAYAGQYLESVAGTAQRPSALFLGGDQVYADDVAGALIGRVGSLARELTGQDELLPGNVTADVLRARFRALPSHFTTETGLTSGHADNHLYSFGDWAALYLLAWSGALWPDLSSAKGPEAQALSAAHASLPWVQKLLANVGTYMIFDDHEVTDDWFITPRWRAQVEKTHLGKRIIANGLAAYWAFQGWGNAPDSYGDKFVRNIEAHLVPDSSRGREEREKAAKDFDEQMWSFKAWDFVAPTRPVAVFVDTRTHRDKGQSSTPRIGNRLSARLISEAGWRGPQRISG